MEQEYVSFGKMVEGESTRKGGLRRERGGEGGELSEKEGRAEEWREGRRK